ncbi:redoxin family protein [Blastopirellula sp. JC732]|uniref:Redoxin family protein n=1 Tax=Blastopirellula sediminis TaxID=2894196 RepID=A0A9X1MKC2_9BACT|nr:TlpA disulfide reductase family protein [Blastopirellula sediminis]MCC9609336.1 redoxin family protein [Blastopirellula sediminis]MCC9627887.1 redoxin family protein [Blastopirellula sediminis]
MRKLHFLPWLPTLAISGAACAVLSFTGCGGGGDAPAASVPAPASTTTADQGAAPAAVSPAQVSAPATGNPAATGNPNAGGTNQLAMKQPDGTAAPQMPAPISAAELDAQVDINKVPQNDPVELLRYMKAVGETNFPNTASQKDLHEFANKVYTNIMEAADRLLALPGATSEQRRDALQFKFHAYEVLASINPMQAEQLIADRTALAQKLTQDPDRAIRTFGMLYMFEYMLQDFASGKQELGTMVKEDALAIIGDPGASTQHLEVAMNAANVFGQMGHSDVAVEILTTARQTFAKSQNKELADASVGLDDHILQWKIFGAMMDAANGDEVRGQEMLQLIQQLVDSFGKESLEPVSTIQAIEQKMEEFNRMALAKSVNDLLLKNYSDHPNEQVAAAIRESAQSANKRLALIGSPLPLVGSNLDGTPFNWADYRGRYVLVDFWATWCGPCLAEIPNIQENFVKYREKGFEVVGVNLDEDPKSLEAFFTKRQLPWTTVISNDPNATGFNNVNAVHCGVDGIPFLVLVDPEGKVVEINPRGERLGEVLDSIFSQQAPAGAGAAAANANANGGAMPLR